MNGLQAVAHVGERTPDDHAHRVVEVARAHLLLDLARRYGLRRAARRCQTSRNLTSLAFCSMKSLRGSTWSPMSVENTGPLLPHPRLRRGSAVASWVIVVSQSCSRILWAMAKGGHQPSRPYVKCARVTGDVMGKYHPHDSSSIYDASRVWCSRSRFAIRSSTVKATSARSTTTRRPPSGTPSAASPSSRRRCSGTSTPTPSTSARTTTSRDASRRSCRPLPEPPRQRLDGHRSRNGYEHPAPQSLGDDRRRCRADRQADRGVEDLM